MAEVTDTIFAPATAPGRAGVAVIRISGPGALAAAEALAGPLPVAGRRLCRLRDSAGDVLDEALVLTFPPGRSFTGEAVAELQVHGSPAVVGAVVRCLSGMPGLRGADPGEFTRRAMDNGRLDLSQAEGLADLIDAETEAQRRQAVRVMSGGLAAKAQEWRSGLLQAAALVAATIDFADEDVPEGLGPQVASLVGAVRDSMLQEAGGVGVAERVRQGFEVAIIGPPNAGKSTLLNTLAGREAAITSARAGTTRDVIEVRMDLGGLPVTLLDTAGLRETEDEVEGIGIARARMRAESADLRVHLSTDGKAVIGSAGPDDIVVGAKADITGNGVSGLTGQGVDRLIGDISGRLRARVATVGVALRERHRAALIRATGHLSDALHRAPLLAEHPDLLAEDLRSAMRAVDALVGRVDVEDILGDIFSRFCIGK
jgi:tRNA modification GTPase